MSRKIPQAVVSTKAGKWEKTKFMGTELYNKTLGLVGLGQIGTYVTKLAQGLAMQVIGYDPYLSPGRAREMGIQTVALDELFRRADFISVHTPLTNETRSLINAQAIRQMKDGVMIVNCARGGIINEHDIYEALKSKKSRRRGIRRVRGRARDAGSSLADPGQLHLLASYRGLDRGSPGKRRHFDCRTICRLFSTKGWLAAR